MRVRRFHVVGSNFNLAVSDFNILIAPASCIRHQGPSPSLSSKSMAPRPPDHKHDKPRGVSYAISSPSLIPSPLRRKSSTNRVRKPSKNKLRDRRKLSQNIVHTLSLGVNRGNCDGKPFYRCSLCSTDLLSGSKPFTLTSGDPESASGRIFCARCWKWVYDVAMC
jgi:hypothetical protein